MEEKADLMMEQIVELGKYSYDMEREREESLIAQSGRMVTAVAVFLALLGTWFTKPLNLSYAAIIVCLLISLCAAVWGGWRYKYTIMHTVDDFYNEVGENQECYETKAQFNMQWKYQISAIHKSKHKINDIRSICIMISMISFISAALLISIALFSGVL